MNLLSDNVIHEICDMVNVKPVAVVNDVATYADSVYSLAYEIEEHLVELLLPLLDLPDDEHFNALKLATRPPQVDNELKFMYLDCSKPMQKGIVTTSGKYEKGIWYRKKKQVGGKDFYTPLTVGQRPILWRFADE